MPTEDAAPVARSLVIGGTGGIGGALVALIGLREAVVALGRRSDPPIDLTDETSIAEAARLLAGRAPFSRIIDATGALTIDGMGPEKRLADIDPARLARAFAINAIGPALLLKHFSPLLPRAGRCVFATLSARVGSIGDNGLGGWYGYRASKAALNQLVRTAAIEIARRRPEALVLAIHPGTVRTGLSAPFTAPGRGFAPEESAAKLLQVLDTADETGVFLDYAGQTIPW
jgi:NAD(P)-dependent dehydrogenase (short-subunit alcohol dehydrogenase family)